MFDILEGNSDSQAVLNSSVAFFGCHPVEYLQRLSDAELFQNLHAQPLIAVLQMATWAALRDHLPPPRVVAGYSLGEVVAYGCVGSLKTEQLLSLVHRRAILMDAAAPQDSAMLAVRGLLKAQVEELCIETGVELAIINGNDHFVLGGTGAAMRRLEQHPLVEQASQCKRLAVTVPSHTSYMSRAAALFANDLAKSGLIEPRTPVLAGTNGGMVRRPTEAIAALTRQISAPINWLACVLAAVETGSRVMLELGPGAALKKIQQEHSPMVVVRAVEDFRSLQGVADWLCRQLQR
jgi:[acyl-carrier-protein] S-malonyltransferase